MNSAAETENNVIKTEWDLSRIYVAPEDFRKDISTARDLAEAFSKKYAGKIAEITAEGLADAFEEYKEILERTWKPSLFTSKRFDLDSGNPTYASDKQEVSEAATAIGQFTTFFMLDVIALPEETLTSFASHPALAQFQHMLLKLVEKKPHVLTESEQKIVNLKNLVGAGAFKKLHCELTSSYRFPFVIDGEEKIFSSEELLALREHADPEIRERAMKTFYASYEADKLVYGSIFNNLMLDHAQNIDLYRHKDPLAPTLMGDETPREAFEALMESSRANYDLARRYYRIKAKLLGLDKLKRSDLSAPLPGCDDTYSLEEAVALVREAFADFDASFADSVDRFFAEGRVDVSPHTGKRTGAYCSGMYPGLPPYVLLNFTKKLGDVFTIAHEFGHGIHFELAQRNHFFNYHPTTTLAESASGFAEILLFDSLMKKDLPKQSRIAMLCERIEGVIGSVFRQVTYTSFEMAAHDARKKGLLSTEDLCGLWEKEGRALYGDAVVEDDAYRMGWASIGHFVFARFYCYSYAFAEMLVMALYARYAEEGAAFVPKLKEFFASGSSASPGELLAACGVDPGTPQFWDKGFFEIAKLIDLLEGLID